MANPEHVHILQLGIDKWNAWRAQNPDIQPDLTMEDLREMDFQGWNFERAQLHGAILTHASLQHGNFRRANLQKANLIGADLTQANLQRANLSDTRMQKAILESADLERANLTKADLREVVATKANFKRATFAKATLAKGVFSNACFHRAHMQWANLFKASFSSATFYRANLENTELILTDFSNAKFDKTTATSKLSFNRLKHPLSSNQLLRITCEEEEQYFEQQANSEEWLQPPIPALRIYTSAGEWTPHDLGLFLIGIQNTINCVQYLHTTQEKDLAKIRRDMANTFPEYEYNIWVKEIRNGSLELFLSYLKSAPKQVTTTAVIVAALFMGTAELIHTIDQHRVSNATIDKLEAETKKLNAETDNLRQETTMSLYNTAPLPEHIVHEIRQNVTVPQEFKPISQTVKEHSQDLISKAAEQAAAVIALAKTRKGSFYAEVGSCEADGVFDPLT